MIKNFSSLFPSDFKNVFVWHLTGKILSFKFYPKAVFFACKFRMSQSAIVHVHNRPIKLQRIESRIRWHQRLASLKLQLVNADGFVECKCVCQVTQLRTHFCLKRRTFCNIQFTFNPTCSPYRTGVIWKQWVLISVKRRLQTGVKCSWRVKCRQQSVDFLTLFGYHFCHWELTGALFRLTWVIVALTGVIV